MWPMHPITFRAIALGGNSMVFRSIAIFCLLGLSFTRIHAAERANGSPPAFTLSDGPFIDLGFLGDALPKNTRDIAFSIRNNTAKDSPIRRVSISCASPIEIHHDVPDVIPAGGSVEIKGRIYPAHNQSATVYLALENRADSALEILEVNYVWKTTESVLDFSPRQMILPLDPTSETVGHWRKTVSLYAEIGVPTEIAFSSNLFDVKEVSRSTCPFQVDVELELTLKREASRVDENAFLTMSYVIDGKAGGKTIPLHIISTSPIAIDPPLIVFRTDDAPGIEKMVRISGIQIRVPSAMQGYEITADADTDSCTVLKVRQTGNKDGEKGLSAASILLKTDRGLDIRIPIIDVSQL